MRSTMYILMAGTLWGIIAIFVHTLQRAGFSSFEVVALRAVGAALLLFLRLGVRQRAQLRIRWRDVPYFIGTGVGSIVFFNYCYFQAIAVIGGAAVPALLMYTAPGFVLGLSALCFGERITRPKVVALVVIFCGLMLVTGVVGSSASVPVLGIVLGLGAGLGYALYSIFGKFVVGRYTAATITFYTFLMAAVVAVPASGVVPHALRSLSWSLMPAVLGLGLFCTVLPFLCYTLGLAGLEASRASLLATVEPVVAAVVGGVYFHEQFTVLELVGMLLVLGAIGAINVVGSRAASDVVTGERTKD